ncbi:hypothetical protein MAPG_03464 [Magnaporthiopsis poae ATCC 64411]|uniref:Uncharacterized protein n=1 Tax=Magnaporthiopsis poae (strain ATCC 64411 / 73-15) TaxID=644358 RepID=A0A0C4DU30_MAGP6|nr:hypothetical protein MAPG_03464 [Magnaporthiopsis poae ATCC 64411]
MLDTTRPFHTRASFPLPRLAKVFTRCYRPKTELGTSRSFAAHSLRAVTRRSRHPPGQDSTGGHKPRHRTSCLQWRRPVYHLLNIATLILLHASYPPLNLTTPSSTPHTLYRDRRANAQFLGCFLVLQNAAAGPPPYHSFIYRPEPQRQYAQLRGLPPAPPPRKPQPGKLLMSGQTCPSAAHSRDLGLILRAKGLQGPGPTERLDNVGDPVAILRALIGAAVGCLGAGHGCGGNDEG